MVAVHVACIAAFFLKFQWSYLAVCLALYYVRMFFITAGYHRYFSHRTFKTSRAFQFVMALMGTSSTQKGVLWWAAHHRHHHRYSDTEKDLHSPSARGFLWSHIGWILSDRYNATRMELVPDLVKYPELRWLNKFHVVPPIALGTILFLAGGWGMLVWGFCISTVILWHSSFSINSLMHLVGTRRYATNDTSRNSAILALITMGEGWHNNHHYYMASTRQGFFWWEIDITYYVLKILSWFRIVWDLREPPAEVFEQARQASA
jgi:stearoyl-CoA desaturase (Delta-9 desaturase)